MTNWKDYIDQKFVPPSDFEFTQEENSSILTAKHKLTGTSVVFYWPSDSWNKIHDVHFYNDHTQGWSGEAGEFEFSEKGVEDMDHLLHPVFTTGWVSRDIYLFGKHFKSIVHFDKVEKGFAFHYYSNDLGCATILLFPVLGFLAALKRIFGMTERKFIPPIKKNLT